MAEETTAAPAASDSLLDQPAPAAAAAPATTEPAKPALSFVFDEKGVDTVFGKVDKDGRPEHVAPKYWDADKKAVKADVVLNQLRWAEGKLGKKLDVIGAPEKGYALEPSEQVPKEVVEQLKDDPRIAAVFTKAKELDLSQKAIGELVTSFLGVDLKQVETNKAAELAKLGDNAQHRLKDVGDYITANFDPQMQATLKGMLTTADAVNAVEALIAKARPPSMIPKGEGNTALTVTTKADWEKFHFATNERGQRLVEIDPEYRKKSQAMLESIVGTSRRDGNGRVVNG